MQILWEGKIDMIRSAEFFDEVLCRGCHNPGIHLGYDFEQDVIDGFGIY